MFVRAGRLKSYSGPLIFLTGILGVVRLCVGIGRCTALLLEHFLVRAVASAFGCAEVLLRPKSQPYAQLLGNLLTLLLGESLVERQGFGALAPTCSIAMSVPESHRGAYTAVGLFQQRRPREVCSATLMLFGRHNAKVQGIPVPYCYLRLPMQGSFLQSARLQFEYYKSLGDKTLERLNEDQLHWQPGQESNSIATIVKHLSGNMRSRWTDFLTTDGEKPFRDREGEFTADASPKAVIVMRWTSGWKLLFAALDDIESTGTSLEQLVYIRAKGHTVVEAVNRQLCHYAYHVGQMVYLGRMLQGADWQSLSIARGESATYNKASFAAGQRKEHFTQEFLEQGGGKSEP